MLEIFIRAEGILPCALHREEGDYQFQNIFISLWRKTVNATTFFSLTSNVALFFMVLYFLFKIRPIKAALVYHTKTQAEFIAAIGLTLVFSILNILASVLGIQVGNALANIRTGVVVVATALLGPLPGIIVGLIGSVYRYTVGGWTALGCSTATFFSGIFCAGIVILLKHKYGRVTLTFKTILLFSVFGGIWEILHTMIFVPILGKKPLAEAIPLLFDLFLFPQVIINAIIIAAVLFLITDLGKQENIKQLQEDEALLRAKQTANQSVIETIHHALRNLTEHGTILEGTMQTTSEGAGHIAGNINSLKQQLMNQAESVTKTDSTVKTILETLNTLDSYIVIQSNRLMQSSSLEEMANNGRHTAEEMKMLNTLTAALTEKMSEMTGDVLNINKAIQTVHEVTQKNAQAIQEVVREVDSFQL